MDKLNLKNARLTIYAADRHAPVPGQLRLSCRMDLGDDLKYMDKPLDEVFSERENSVIQALVYKVFNDL